MTHHWARVMLMELESLLMEESVAAATALRPIGSPRSRTPAKQPPPDLYPRSFFIAVHTVQHQFCLASRKERLSARAELHFAFVWQVCFEHKHMFMMKGVINFVILIHQIFQKYYRTINAKFKSRNYNTRSFRPRK
jgi:hypothetical protein